MIKSLLPLLIGIIAIGLILPQLFPVSYFYFAAFTVLQYIILSTAWNLLGGYVGYVNFGVGAFFGLGAYTSAILIVSLKANLFLAMVAGGLVAGLLGFGLGYLTIRLRGVYFAIATLALSVIIQMLVVNTPWLGGARGLQVQRPHPIPPFSNYLEFLFAIMLLLAFASAMAVRFIEKSWVGRSFTAIRDCEEAAECMGMPVFRLKLFATTLSGFMMGLAGAPFPYYITYMEPYSVMGLDVTLNSLAMPLVGGRGTWLGPILGAMLMGALHQIVTVTISTEYNLLIAGFLLISFVILAPGGIMGLIRGKRQRAAADGKPIA
jgi:branched-chain amino acid transport system permease protein